MKNEFIELLKSSFCLMKKKLLLYLGMTVFLVITLFIDFLIINDLMNRFFDGFGSKFELFFSILKIILFIIFVSVGFITIVYILKYINDDSFTYKNINIQIKRNFIRNVTCIALMFIFISIVCKRQ